MNTEPSIDCSDLYEDAAERLKDLDNDIDKIIQDLAKMVEARGVPKNKVARQVVKELTAREVLSPSRIYEGLDIEQKRKYKKRETEETFPQAKNISAEESSTYQQAVKEIAYLREENTRLKSEKEELERQLAEKTELICELRKNNEGPQKARQPELLREIRKRFYAGPELLKGKELEKISEKAGRDIEKILQHYNTFLGDVAGLGLPIPLGTYIITKPDMVLVPVRIMINFDKMEVELSLWKKKLQIPSPSTSLSSNASKAASNLFNTSTPSMTPRESTGRV